MFLRLDGRGPLNRQLYRALREAIGDATLKPGDRVMPTRTLRARLGLSRNVVLMAYAQLEAEGYLTARQGSGTFVAQNVAVQSVRQRRRSIDPPLSDFSKRLLALPPFDFDLAPLPANHFDFRYGRNHVPEETRADWLRMERRTPQAAFASTELSGLPELRRAIAAYLRQHRGLTVDADDILITSGARETLDLTLRLFAEPGVTIAVEDPHYLPFGMLARSYGARLHHVPVDALGMNTERLPQNAALAYLTPSHQYPTGAVLAINRRHALLKWAAECGAFLVEDDYDSEYRYDAQPLPPLKTLDAHERVIYVGSFSKVLTSAVRVGFIVAPPSLVPAYRRLKSLAIGGTGTRMQSILAAFINEGLFARHLRRMRRVYAERRSRLLDAVERHLMGTVDVMDASAGLHVMIHAKDWAARDGATFMKMAAERRVGIFAATHLFEERPKSLPLLLGFGGIEAQRIDAGTRALGQAVRSRA